MKTFKFWTMTQVTTTKTQLHLFISTVGQQSCLAYWNYSSYKQINSGYENCLESKWIQVKLTFSLAGLNSVALNASKFSQGYFRKIAVTLQLHMMSAHTFHVTKINAVFALNQNGVHMILVQLQTSLHKLAQTVKWTCASCMPAEI